MTDTLKQPDAPDDDREREIGTVEPAAPNEASSGDPGASGGDAASAEDEGVGGG